MDRFKNRLSQWSLKMWTGRITEGLSGTLIENPDVGVKKAKCPLCSHEIEVSGMGFAVDDPACDDRAVIMCGRCCAFLFVTPPGFTPISEAELQKLPMETRTILQRQRQELRGARRLMLLPSPKR